MFQNVFLLPVPADVQHYIEQILISDTGDFKTLLVNRFGLQNNDWPTLIATLNDNLPHNPRKLKGFIAAWKVYTGALANRHPNIQLDWRLLLILNYLGQFEEPLFRRVEIDPGFYSDVLTFCQRGNSPHRHFEGLELSRQGREAAAAITGSLSMTDESSPSTAAGTTDKPPPLPRLFHCGKLILEIGEVDLEEIQRHLLGANPAQLGV